MATSKTLPHLCERKKEAMMFCRQCASENHSRLSSEIAVHYALCGYDLAIRGSSGYIVHKHISYESFYHRGVRYTTQWNRVTTWSVGVAARLSRMKIKSRRVSTSSP